MRIQHPEDEEIIKTTGLWLAQRRLAVNREAGVDPLRKMEGERWRCECIHQTGATVCGCLLLDTDGQEQLEGCSRHV